MSPLLLPLINLLKPTNRQRFESMTDLLTISHLLVTIHSHYRQETTTAWIYNLQAANNGQ